MLLFQILAQETLNPKIVDLIGQGIISAAILVIWFYQFKQSNKQQEEANKRYELLSEQNSEITKESFVVIKEDIRYKELIAGYLSGIETNQVNIIKDIERINK